MTPLNHIIRRPIAVLMIYLVILVTGVVSFLRLPLELMPGVEFPRLSVSTGWRNSTPEAVEAFITSPIEGVCNTITGVRKVSSYSQEGTSTVTAEFIRGTDMDFAALELNEKLSSSHPVTSNRTNQQRHYS